MPILLRLIPWFLLALAQLLALVATFTARETPTSAAERVLAIAMYGVALLLSVGAAVAAIAGWRSAGLFAIATAVAACAAPLIWGHAHREFHASHHLVRAVLVAGCVVLYFSYVAAHR